VTSEGNLSVTFLYHASAVEDLYKLNFATPIAVVLASKDEDPGNVRYRVIPFSPATTSSTKMYLRGLNGQMTYG